MKFKNLRSNKEFTVSVFFLIIFLKLELIKNIKNPDNFYETVEEAGIVNAEMISSDGK